MEKLIFPDGTEKEMDAALIGGVSDGYHTFEELYEHRYRLFIALCRYFRHPNKLVNSVRDELTVWRSKKHSDGNDAYDGWFIMGIKKQQGSQISYHLPLRLWNETSFAETLEKAPKFDGHTSADVLERLKTL